MNAIRPESALSRCFAAFALVCAVACAAPETGDGESGDGVTARQFRDVVVPDGLRLIDDEHQSYSRKNGAWRRGHFVYRGNTSVAEAAAYVLQRMPQHDWQEQANESSQPNRRRLAFARGIYRTEYQLVREYGRTEMIVDYITTLAEDAVGGDDTKMEDAAEGAKD